MGDFLKCLKRLNMIKVNIVESKLIEQEKRVAILCAGGSSLKRSSFSVDFCQTLFFLFYLFLTEATVLS